MDWRASPLIGTWWGEERNLLARILRVPLLPFAGVFAAGAAVRGAAYRRGWLSTRRLPVPVVSVGNLTVGGTGKTPMVRWVAERLRALGRRPLVFSSGFGARAGDDGLDEEGAFLAGALPGIPVVQGRDPHAAVAAFFESGKALPDVVVLDDGFQKLDVARDADIVMLDATRPFGSGLMLPAGPLRERRHALERATVIVLSRTELAPPDRVLALRNALLARFPGIPVLRQRHEPSGLVFSGQPASSLKGARVWLVSAIAHPRAFETTVKRLGAHVLGHTAFRDHAPLGPRAVARALARARDAGAAVLLASAKDAPKLEAFRDATPRLDALDIAVAFEDDPGPLLAILSSLSDRPAHALPTQRS